MEYRHLLWGPQPAWSKRRFRRVPYAVSQPVCSDAEVKEYFDKCAPPRFTPALVIDPRFSGAAIRKDSIVGLLVVAYDWDGFILVPRPEWWAFWTRQHGRLETIQVRGRRRHRRKQ